MEDYRAFVVAHADGYLRLSRLLTGDPHEAEDLTQEALGLVLRKWHLVARADNPVAYGRRLLVNLHHSRARSAPPRSLPLDRSGCDPEAQASTPFEERDALRRAVAQLPVRQRTVLVLRYYEDLDVAEIAAATGLRDASVRSALARALDTLRTTSSLEAPHG